jgi:SAM-dependent methyltransferase
MGVDIDPAGVQVLQSMGYNAVCADAETMDLGRTFDTIVAGEVIEHPEYPGLFLRNLRRHLAANGRLFISTPNPFYADQSWKIWRYGRPAVHEDHLGWQDPITLAALLRHTGFEPLEGWWVQPECKLLRTWKRLFRRHFSHTFMILARPGRFDRASLADAGSPGGKEAR